MPPRRRPSDDPREWLNRARSDLTMAKAKGPEIYYEDLYLRRPFQREPDFHVRSVNYSFPELLAQAEPPR